MREIVSPLSGIRSPFGGRVDPYKAAGFRPTLVADMTRDYYRNTSRQTFDDIFTTSRLGNATMVDSDGLRKWAPHNLLTYSEDFSNAAWNKVNVTSSGAYRIIGSVGTLTKYVNQAVTREAGVKYTVAVVVDAATAPCLQIIETGAAAYMANFDLVSGVVGTKGSNTTSAITALGDGRYLCHAVFNGASGYAGGTRFYLQDTASATYGQSATTTGYCDFLYARSYRSDLGGMAPVPADARVAGSTTYVPTTSTAKYLPRRHNHVYNGSAWVDAGTLIETEARTQLLHTTNTLVTQSHTVTAVPHTLHFTGTGTVTLSGASTAGPLVGTGTGEENRVSLTFTPTAGILILIVSGTVTDAQLEVGSTPSSYTPNLAASGTVTRAADTNGLTVDSSIVPWGDAVAIQMSGRMTYADTGVSSEIRFLRWLVDGSNYIIADYATDGAYDRAKFEQRAAGTIDNVQNTSAPYSPGINVPFNIASRHGSTFINGAVDGVALTADLTPVALPDLSSTDLQIGYDFMGNIEEVRVWVVDIGDTGLEAATS